MKQLKKIVALVLTLCIIVAASGCLAQVNEEKNSKIVLATIDGEVDITKGEFLPIFNSNYINYYYYYYILGKTMSNDDIKSLKSSVLESMIKDKIIHIEMDKISFDYTDEDLESGKKDYEKNVQDYADELKEEAEKAKESEESEKSEETTERDYLQEAKDYYEKNLAAEGMTIDDYIKELADSYRIERFKKTLAGDITVSDDEIKKYYDNEKAAQTEKPDLDAEVLIFEPESVVYKYIKVTLSTEEKTEYNSLTSANKTEEAAQYLKDTVMKRAEEYASRIKAGESFEAVMDDANKFLVDKCGIAESSISKSDKELTLYKNVGKSGLEGEFDTKILSTKEGEATEILASGSTTYVIGKVYKRNASVTKEYEVGNELYEEIKTVLVDKATTTAIEEALKKLYESHDVKVYTSRLYKNY